MPYTLIIKEEAKLDLSTSYAYYEEQQEGQGERFLDEVQKRFDNLVAHPEYYTFIDSKQSLRDITVGIFPYVIIYKIVAMEVRIYAVLHTHKKPPRKYR